MITGVWGHKVGMTQIFSDNKVTPVTVINVGNWFVTEIKTVARDGYNAIQVSCVRDRYKGHSFDKEWLKSRKQYFRYTREIKGDDVTMSDEIVGTSLNALDSFSIGMLVDVTGWTKGLGFAGVYKRHGFGGAPKSHGSMMGRRPGSIGFTRSSGEIMRGQKMAGHKGCDRTVMKRLGVIAVEGQENLIFVKGSVPGKAGSLVYVAKV